eukprot:PRCOL_00004035-RA
MQALHVDAAPYAAPRPDARARATPAPPAGGDAGAPGALLAARRAAGAAELARHAHARHALEPALRAAAADDVAALSAALNQIGWHSAGAWAPWGMGGTGAPAAQRTPLMVAATFGALNCVRTLLAAGADPNAAAPDDGATALHCAAAGGSSRAVQAVAALLQQGADAGAVDRAGQRPADVVFALQPPDCRPAELVTALHCMLGGLVKAQAPAGAAPMVPGMHFQQPVGAGSPPRPPSPPGGGGGELIFGSPARGGGDAAVPRPMPSPPPAAAAAAVGSYEHSGAVAQPQTEPSDLDRDEYQTDHFRMYEFKVHMCPKTRAHDWTECPFAHPGEKARRRDPRRFKYSGTACPDFRKGACRRGDACEFAHGVFECWLHPSRYRTQLCKDGRACPRRVCFFAHCPSELRAPDSVPMCMPTAPPRTVSPGKPASAAEAVSASAPGAPITGPPTVDSSPTSALSLGSSPNGGSPSHGSSPSSSSLPSSATLMGATAVPSSLPVSVIESLKMASLHLGDTGAFMSSEAIDMPQLRKVSQPSMARSDSYLQMCQENSNWVSSLCGDV